MITMPKIPFVAHFWWQVCPQTLAESNPQHTHTHTHILTLIELLNLSQTKTQTNMPERHRKADGMHNAALTGVCELYHKWRWFNPTLPHPNPNNTAHEQNTFNIYYV